MHLHLGLHGLANSPDEKPKITWPLLKRVLHYARPYRGLILGMLVLILTSTGLSLLTPLILRDLIDKTIPARNTQRLVWLALGLLLIPSLNGFINVVQRRLSARVGEGVIYDLRLALYANLQRMSLRFFTNTKTGELMSRLNNDVVGAQNAISSTIVNIVTQFVQAAAVLGMMLTLEWRLTLISVVILPLFLIAARMLGNRLRDMARAQMESNARMNAMMSETLNIGGALLVKLFGRQQVEVDRFSQRAAQVRELGVQRAFGGSIFFAIIGLISAVGTAMVYGLGGYFVIQGAFTVGTIVAFGAYLGSLYGALQGLSNAPVEFATSMVSFERVFEVIDLPVELPEKPDAVPLTNVREGIEFKNVSFHYESGDENLLSDVHRYGSIENVSAVLSGEAAGGEDEEAAPKTQARGIALEDISFQARAGHLVALVGPSGAGKTTLTYLIPRLYDPSSGAIYIDGYDLRRLTLQSLSSQIGMVTQETYLFHDTIRTNLQYAKLDATQAELEAACRVANIHNFIQALPDGYDTIVGERGYRLSGGEKQRIALARVILKDPRILVLDEATSSLDSESEALIQDALAKVMAQRTSIVIAHRLSTILAADLILVLDRGRIVESGTHKDLLAREGIYAHLYRTQFRSQDKVI
ncbi:ABC-type multidrug transport system, ATPase and permease component [Longilinea arvoryzae]|uniref:ABC-type multidrug transport system, ATPase and permease component n=1 Tax=Longilinea arvoryzae TaxID=360412 RepID=A0A0S7B7W9_9CHLR|nr:ABC transporter ATP-binding protein [Longilinea arvoryzae]GAP13383.1 ABC-type multidrug transport system, ATPase and permease component [Longilinea arvoryzae]